MRLRVIMAIAALAAALATGGLAAAVAAYEVPCYVLAAGGGRLLSGSYILDGTVGQAVTGIVGAGTYQLQSGFWFGNTVYRNYLPLVLRNTAS